MIRSTHLLQLQTQLQKEGMEEKKKAVGEFPTCQYVWITVSTVAISLLSQGQHTPSGLSGTRVKDYGRD